MDGYIVLSEKNSFLTKNHFWFHHDTLDTSWVHTNKEYLWSVLNSSSSWKIAPKYVARACFDGEKTVLNGEYISLETWLRDNG